MTMQHREEVPPSSSEYAPLESLDALVAALTASVEQAVRLRGRSLLVLGLSPTTLRVCRRWTESWGHASFWHYTVVFLAAAVLPDAAPMQDAAETARPAEPRCLPVPSGNMHAVDPTLPAEDAAAAYERALRMALELRPGELPRFDLVLVGLDAELCRSGLYPRSWGRSGESRLVLTVEGDEPGTTLVAITPLALASSRECVLVAPPEPLAGGAPLVEPVTSIEQLLAMMGTTCRRVQLAAPTDAMPQSDAS